MAAESGDVVKIRFATVKYDVRGARAVPLRQYGGEVVDNDLARLAGKSAVGDRAPFEIGFFEGIDRVRGITRRKQGILIEKGDVIFFRKHGGAFMPVVHGEDLVAVFPCIGIFQLHGNAVVGHGAVADGDDQVVVGAAGEEEKREKRAQDRCDFFSWRNSPFFYSIRYVWRFVNGNRKNARAKR